MKDAVKGFALIEIIVVLAVICMMAYFMLKHYSGAVVPDAEVAQTLSEQGINAESHVAIVDSTSSMLGKIEQKQAEQYQLLHQAK